MLILTDSHSTRMAERVPMTKPYSTNIFARNIVTIDLTRENDNNASIRAWSRDWSLATLYKSAKAAPIFIDLTNDEDDMPIPNMETDEINNECSICFDAIAEKDVFSPCGHDKHLFHSSCIIKWFDSVDDDPTCPLCRKPFS